MRITDEVWETIREYMRNYCKGNPIAELRNALEKTTQIYVFDGGVFISIGNEFDLFVVPAKRGRWRIRSEITKYLKDMGRRYGTIAVTINVKNQTSLRLAKFFKFEEISRDGDFIRLESTSWAV